MADSALLGPQTGSVRGFGGRYLSPLWFLKSVLHIGRPART